MIGNVLLSQEICNQELSKVEVVLIAGEQFLHSSTDDVHNIILTET